MKLIYLIGILAVFSLASASILANPHVDPDQVAVDSIEASWGSIMSYDLGVPDFAGWNASINMSLNNTTGYMVNSTE